GRYSEKGSIITMEIIVDIMAILGLTLVMTSLLWVIFTGMRGMVRKGTGKQTMNPLTWRPRFRANYRLSRGVWHRVGVQDRRGFHNERYERRHPPKRHKPAKPWMG